VLEHPSEAQRELLLARKVTHANVVRIHDLGELRASDFDALLGEHTPALGGDVPCGDPPDETVVRFTAGLEGHHFDVVLGATVGLADDHVLSNVDQTPRQIARVGGTQGGVGQSLARAVR